VIADAALLTRALTSLLAAALARSPGDAPPLVTAASADGTVRIRATGCSHWTDPEGLPVRIARDLTEAMGDTLDCERSSSGDRAVVITLPAAARSPVP